MLTHDFGGAIVFISVNSEGTCNSSHVNKEHRHTRHRQEEADTKIIVHLKHCLLNCFKNL